MTIAGAIIADGGCHNQLRHGTGSTRRFVAATVSFASSGSLSDGVLRDDDGRLAEQKKPTAGYGRLAPAAIEDQPHASASTEGLILDAGEYVGANSRTAPARTLQRHSTATGTNDPRKTAK